MYKCQQLSDQSLFPCRKAKQNDSKYLNAIKPYVAKQRRNSKKDTKSIISNNPYENSRSKSRKNQNSCRKNIEENISSSKYLGDVYSQLKNLKSQYKSLKDAYNNMKKINEQLSARENYDQQEIVKVTEKYENQIQKYQQKNEFLQSQLERMKKQCFRLLETQKFKNKKLEETLQEKQLMIAYLRSQLALLNGQPPNNSSIFMFQHTAPAYKNSEHNQCVNQSESIINSRKIQINLPRQVPQTKKGVAISTFLEQNSHISKPNLSLISKNIVKQQNSPEISQIKQKRQYIFSNSDNSFSFSREKSKEQSIIQSDGEQATVLTFTKKDVIIFEQESKGNNYLQKNVLVENNNNLLSDQLSDNINDMQGIQKNYSSSQFDVSGEFTGQQQILTFQNRRLKVQNQDYKDKTCQKKNIREKQSQSEKNIAKKHQKIGHKNIKNKNIHDNNLSHLKNTKIKSRPNTRRLQIQTDDEGAVSSSKITQKQKLKDNFQGESSEMRKKLKNKKKSASANLSHNVRKRKSEECGSSYIKK